MQEVYLSVGGNLQDPVVQVKKALDHIRDSKNIELMQYSSFYKSEPLGGLEQPHYVNAVAKVKTSLSADALLKALQDIENTQGRIRTSERWGPRIIDLDILLYGNEIIQTEALTIPHYGMKEREFVLYPLVEITPDLILPTGESLKELIKNCPKDNLSRIEEE